MQKQSEDNLLFVDSLEERVKQLKRKMETFSSDLPRCEPVPIFKAINGGNSTDVKTNFPPGSVKKDTSVSTISK